MNQVDLEAQEDAIRRATSDVNAQRISALADENIRLVQQLGDIKAKIQQAVALLDAVLS